MPDPSLARSDELDEVLDLIVAQQTRPERCCTYLGHERDGVLAELEHLSPPWTTTARVLRDPDGLIRGAAVIEWDQQLGRAWVLGPWHTGDDRQWTAASDLLVGAVLAELPDGVVDVELSGDVHHELLAALAARLGWPATEVNHALVATAAVAAAWPSDDTAPLRPARPADLPQVAALHEQHFPATHTAATTLLAPEGDHVVMVAEVDGRTVGYAAGQVHPDGEGHLDFVAVAETERRSGLGRHLVTTIGRRLLTASTTGRVCLTVEDRRAPARRLYASLGFVPEVSIAGYRSTGQAASGQPPAA